MESYRNGLAQTIDTAKTQPSIHQKTLDFDRHLKATFNRHQQMTMIERAILPHVTIQEGKLARRVKPRDMGIVLRVVDGHGRGRASWPSILTISKEGRLSRCQVLRAMLGLQAIGIICIEKRPKRGGGFSNLYVIVWSELAVLCPGDTLKLRGGEHRPHETNHGPQASEHRPQGSDHDPQVGTRTANQEPLIGSAQENQSDDSADDGDLFFSFLEERLEKFFALFPECEDPNVRQRVLTILAMEFRKKIPDGTVQMIVRELLEIQKKGRLKKMRALLYRLMKNRGHDLDLVTMKFPPELLERHGDAHGELPSSSSPSNSCRSEAATPEETKTEKEKYPADFEEFWNAYPKRDGRRNGKVKTLKLWKTLSADDRGLLLVAAQNFSLSRQADDNKARDPERFFEDDWWREWTEPSDAPSRDRDFAPLYEEMEPILTRARK